MYKDRTVDLALISVSEEIDLAVYTPICLPTLDMDDGQGQECHTHR